MEYYNLLLEFWTLSIVWYSERNTTFRKLDLFPSSGENVARTYSAGSVIKRYGAISKVMGPKFIAYIALVH
jgi:phosphoribosylaminoimidazole-succinocarboxamide synthase